jgi:putative intracellular protease/amidase
LLHYDTEPEPIESVRPETPPELAALLRRMMAKKPEDRVQTPSEVAETLAPLIKGTPTKKAPVRAATPATAKSPRRGATTAEMPAPRLRRQISPRARLGIGMAAVGGMVMLGVVLWAVFVGPEPDNVPKKPDGGGAIAPPAGSRHVLYILPRMGVWYNDFGPVRDMLVKNGVQVTVAANAEGHCQLATSSSGEPVKIDVTLSKDMDLTPYDAVIFGGMGVYEYANPDHDAGKIVRQVIDSMEKSNKIVAALCTGQLVLASAGTLQGKRAAYNQKVAEKLPNAADWRKDKTVEMHDHIITGGHPQDATEFAEKVLEALKK